MKLYHGTDKRAAANIIRNGLLPGSHLVEERELAEHYANRAGGAAGDPYGVIVEVEIANPLLAGFRGPIDADSPIGRTWQTPRALQGCRYSGKVPVDARKSRWYQQVREARKENYRRADPLRTTISTAEPRR